MPTINVDISQAKSFEDLPVGEYYGQIAKLAYHPPRVQGKQGQIRVQYQVIDGEHEGRSMSQFLSLSDKAAFRLVNFMRKFGGDWETMNPEELKNIQIETLDDDTVEYLAGVDLTDLRVIFKVFTGKDRDGNPRAEAELVSVEDEVDTGADASDGADDSADDGTTAPAPVTAADAPDEPVGVPAAARTAPAARVATAARPQRRTLK
jgi:hypothetical protein